MKTYIKGNYRKSIFHSEKGYVIGLFKVRETNNNTLEEYINKTITFTGFFHELNDDDTYIFYGEETNHPRYGFQFSVTEYEKVKPEDKEGIIDFLSSDLFKGIGDKLAKNIVEILGENAIEKILKDKTCLYLVPKLSEKKANQIYETLYKYDESHQTIVYLTNLGFSMKDALSIYNKYKTLTIEIMNNNIYKITEDIPEISFLKLDTIAIRNNMEKDDKRRIKSLIIYVMNNMIYQKGDTYLNKEAIINNVTNYLKIDIDYNTYDKCFIELQEENKIIIEKEDYYLKSIYDAEKNIINKIYNLLNKEVIKNKNLDNLINEYEKINNIIYNDKQKEAIIKALNNNILIITGGPGTGKTTIIKAITELYQKINKLNYDSLVQELALLAPTGRASKRISQSTLLPASTIHRFLKWNKETNEFMVNEIIPTIVN